MRGANRLFNNNNMYQCRQLSKLRVRWVKQIVSLHLGIYCLKQAYFIS